MNALIPNEYDTSQEPTRLPRDGRSYYLAIVRGYPERLRAILTGYGWDVDKLRAEAEATFPSEEFPDLSLEDKMSALLSQMENQARTGFEPVMNRIRIFLNACLPAGLLSAAEAAINRFRSKL